MFEMQNDRLSSFSSMDMLSEIDGGQVVVNPNILLLENVCFKAEDVVQVNSYRMDCQMRMADCQNSDFHELHILKLQIGGRGMHERVHNDQFLCFVDQITSKQVQRIPEDYLRIIYFTFAEFSDFRASLGCVHQCSLSREYGPIFKMRRKHFFNVKASWKASLVNISRLAQCQTVRQRVRKRKFRMRSEECRSC